MATAEVDNDYMQELARGFNRFALQAYIQAVASKGNLRVEMSTSARSVDFSKPGVVKIPQITSAHDVVSITRILRIIDAAASTYRYGVDTEFLASKGMTKQDSLLSIAVNILERDRCDYLGTKEFAGDANILDGYYQIEDQFTSPLDTLKQKAEEQSDAETRKAINVLASLQLLDILLKSDYVISAGQLYEKAKAHASKQSVEVAEALYDMFQEEHRRNYFNSINPTKTSYEIAKRIFSEATGEDAQEEEQACQNSGGGEGDNYGNLSSALGTAGEDGEPGEEISSDCKPETPPPMSEYDEDNHSKRISLDGSGSGHGMTYGDFESYAEASSFRVASDDEIVVVDFPRKSIHKKGSSGHATKADLEHMYFSDRSMRNEYKEALDSMDTGKGLANSVRRILEINTRSSWQYGKKKGKIHSPNLYRVTMKDAKGFNERVFKNKQERYSLDVAVSLLVDYSGSMSGSKLEHAIQAAYLLQESVGQSLRIPVEVLGFTDAMDAGSTMLIFKGFNDKVSPENLKSYMAAGGEFTCENADGEAIAWAHKRIANRNEKRKIQIVFSDGSPACPRRGIVNYTKEVVRGIEEDSPVEIYGIGIMDGSVKKFYKEHQVIKNPEELEGALLNLIKRAIIR